jgi:hypothetical protein
VGETVFRKIIQKERRKEGREGEREGLMDSDRGTKISES